MVPGARLLPVPHGRLEAIFRAPADRAPGGAALVLHPHPLYGGTMHNPVVFHCARAFLAAGFATLRVNFRGVGESTGTYDHGRGELDDARAALDHLLVEVPAAPRVIVAGFSFGSVVGLHLACSDARATGAIAIGTPVGMTDLADLASCRLPKLFIHGERDDVAPLSALRDALDRGRIAPPAELRVVAGAGHFFESGMDELRAAVAAFAVP